jgi:redox-sensitive bicupin YhaK (pirin superfamily)
MQSGTRIHSEPRLGYLVPATGSVEINGVEIGKRDGAAIRDVAVLTIKALEDSEFVLADAA